MSARIVLHGFLELRPATGVVCLDSFRPEGRLPAEERRLLARMRLLERALRAKASEARALRMMARAGESG
jgi:hypothetical protein